MQNLCLLGVMDGHGVNGQLVSQYVKSHLPSILINLIAGVSTDHAVITSPKRNKYPAPSGLLPSIAKQKGSTNLSSQDPSPKFSTGEEWFKSDHNLRDKHIKESFVLTQDKLDRNPKIDAIFSGTTCVMCFMTETSLICANSGDSRAILCT